MPHRLRDPEDPREWMRRARSSLARAAAGPPTPEVLYEDLAFDAQQAAEKAVKAVLVGRKTAFPKTHSLERLLDLVEQGGDDVPAPVREAGTLTPYAAATRYPGIEPVTEDQYQAALAVSRAVVEWAQLVVERISPGEREGSEDPIDEPDQS